MTEDKRLNEIIRIQKKRNNFVMLDKTFLEDNRLSYKAKGILAYLLSKPDNWKVIIRDLMNHSQDREKSVYAGLNELKKYGYYEKNPVRNEKGIIVRWESIIYELPNELSKYKSDNTTSETPKNAEKSPLAQNLQMDNRQIENGGHNNIYISNNDYTDNEVSCHSHSHSHMSKSTGSTEIKTTMTHDKVTMTDDSSSSVKQIAFKEKEKGLAQTQSRQEESLAKSNIQETHINTDYTTYDQYESIVKTQSPPPLGGGD